MKDRQHKGVFMKKDLKTDITRFMKRLLGVGAITTIMFAAGCKGPDGPPLPQPPTISSGELLVRLSGNEHNRDVSVDARTWGFTSQELQTLKTELKVNFDKLPLIIMENLADNKIMEFGIVKGLESDVEWYTGFLNGSKASGKHIMYFPPEDIESLAYIVLSGESAVLSDIVPNTPATWTNGVPPLNAGRAARLYNVAQESMMAGMIPANTR